MYTCVAHFFWIDINFIRTIRKYCFIWKIQCNRKDEKKMEFMQKQKVLKKKIGRNLNLFLFYFAKTIKFRIISLPLEYRHVRRRLSEIKSKLIWISFSLPYTIYLQSEKLAIEMESVDCEPMFSLHRVDLIPCWNSIIRTKMRDPNCVNTINRAIRFNNSLIF